MLFDMTNDEKYMLRCLELARLGGVEVAPNPMVGAVIVYQDRIIGEGFHQKYGEAHAEVNAVNSVHDKKLLVESCIYVSLEPCAHVGKTPPCSDLLIHHQFRKVVVGCIDPFAEVAGKGIEKLKKAGIEVVVGVLEKESIELNKRFFTFHQKKRPYITLKWAQTKNGMIDINRSNSEKGIHWISQPETKTLVHSWRAQEQAILVGKNTVINDNPSLTVREVDGKNPIRIVLDSNCTLNTDFSVFNTESKTIIFNLNTSKKENNLEWIQQENMELKTILETLYHLGIHSVLVEGGKTVLEQFIFENYWDEARIIVGKSEIQAGILAPIIPKTPSHTTTFSNDTIFHFHNL
jgi:diaminohydroxyphosphoribosylaminopyrimidine deaminase/5-amino-6-(5-phosphoribosylamino)uracil reductase